MKKYILAVTFDVLFFSFVAFLSFLIILRFFFGINYALIFSACLAIVAGFISAKLLYRKTSKKHKNLSESKEVELFSEDYAIKTEKEKSSLIYSSLKKAGYTLEKKKHGIFIVEKNLLVYIKFGYDELKKSDIVLSYNSLSENEKAGIFFYKADDDVINFIKRFKGKVVLFDKFYLYNLLKKTDLLPIRDKNITSKPKINFLLKEVLNKKRAVKYLLFGLAFLLLSFLVSYKIYYLIVGFCFLVLGVVSKIYGKQPVPESNIEL